MIRRALPVLLLAGASASAGDRSYPIGGFDRVRVAGPFEVTHAPGPPRARVEGDPDVVERVELRVDGSTLSVRMGGQGWGERPRASSTRPLAITLSSPSLAGASVSAGGRFSAARMKGARVDLALNGSGVIAVAAVDADQLSATLTGAGVMTLAGRARAARLLSNGTGNIDAEKLEAGDLSALLDGPGEMRARARYTAKVTNVGLGSVTVAGAPKCTVTARGGGPVTCGR